MTAENLGGRRPRLQQKKIDLFRDHVRQFGDERAIDKTTGKRIAVLVVHHKYVAQRTMNDVEPHVRAPLVRIAVVLNERI